MGVTRAAPKKILGMAAIGPPAAVQPDGANIDSILVHFFSDSSATVKYHPIVLLYHQNIGWLISQSAFLRLVLGSVSGSAQLEPGALHQC